MLKRYKLISNQGVVLGTAFSIKGLKNLGIKNSEYNFSLDIPLKKLDKGTHHCFLDDKEAKVIVS